MNICKKSVRISLLMLLLCPLLPTIGMHTEAQEQVDKRLQSLLESEQDWWKVQRDAIRQLILAGANLQMNIFGPFDHTYPSDIVNFYPETALERLLLEPKTRAILLDDKLAAHISLSSAQATDLLLKMGAIGDIELILFLKQKGADFDKTLKDNPVTKKLELVRFLLILDDFYKRFEYGIKPSTKSTSLLEVMAFYRSLLTINDWLKSNVLLFSQQPLTQRYKDYLDNNLIDTIWLTLESMMNLLENVANKPVDRDTKKIANLIEPISKEVEKIRAIVEPKTSNRMLSKLVELKPKTYKTIVEFVQESANRILNPVPEKQKKTTRAS